MGQALYRKYRSKSFDELVGQEHITTTLKNALKDGRISHAYLFTGPKGVGKTSAARILAHAVNNIAYTDESVHLDIIEIDAASNRRIDEIRDLRDKVHISPTSAKYKVYIIDEVHMLTKEAFNALLKTLEEPPAHCIFILATTESHKLPETIVSRTQRFSFKPISDSDIVTHLKKIASREKLNIDTEALKLIAKHSQGSFRDSISILDQLSGHSKKISSEHVRDLLGIPPNEAILQLLKNVEEGDNPAIIKTLSDLYYSGITAANIARQLGSNIREQIINGHQNATNITLLRELLDVPTSPHAESTLELCLLEATNANEVITKPSVVVLPKSTEQTPVDKERIQNASRSKPFSPPMPNTHTPFDLKKWPEILNEVKIKAPSIYTALRICVPNYSAGVLELCFEFPLHKNKVENIKNKQIIGKIVEDICSCKVEIEAIVDKSKFKLEKPKNEHKKVEVDEPIEVPAKNESLKTISNIFGPAEVLES